MSTKSVWVPLSAFALAISLSFLSGPSGRLLARPPGETSSAGKCACQLKVLDIKGRADGSLFEIGDDKSPHINKLTVKIEAKICQEKRAAAPPADVLTDAFLDLKADLMMLCKGQLEGDTVNLRTVLKPQKVDPLTCPGKNYPYSWDGDKDSLFLAAVEKALQVMKLKKKTEDCELLDVFLQLHGPGFNVDYIVSTETRCDGEFMINSCESRIPLRKKKGVLELKGEDSKNCNTFVCRFGTP
jgi:hypothetical protein